ncbi:MAG: MBL fold metallo-hydrolase [Hyphomicrobium sp.]
MPPRLDLKTSMDFAYEVPSPVAPGIIRVVAENPGVMTFKGTNTYLVGTTELAVIDPGPDDERHVAAVMTAAAGRPITHILTTHSHRDHVDAAARLKSATGAVVAAARRETAPVAGIGEAPARPGYVNFDFEPDRTLGDGDIVSGEDWTLEAIHTPGHAPDHLCFALARRGILFSGDHVMAWNTTVVAPPEGHMASYLTSLERLLARPSDRMYLPGHGGRISAPRRTVKAYLLHRRWREQTIVSAIREGAPTIRTIVPVVYQAIDPGLLPAAALSVLAHVEHLIERGLVVCDGEPAFDRRLALA